MKHRKTRDLCCSIIPVYIDAYVVIVVFFLVLEIVTTTDSTAASAYDAGLHTYLLHSTLPLLFMYLVQVPTIFLRPCELHGN